MSPAPAEAPAARGLEDPTALDAGAFTAFETGGSAVLRRVAVTLVGSAALRGKGLITLPLAVAVLGSAGYGNVTAALAVAGGIAPLALLNVPDGAARLVVGADEALAAERVLSLRRVGLVVAALLSVLGGVLTLAGAAFPVTGGVTVAAATTAFQVSAVHLQYFQRTTAYIRLQLVAEYLTLGLGLAVALVLGATGMVLVNAVVLWVVSVVARRTLPGAELLAAHPGARHLSRPFWRPALRLAIPLTPVVLSNWALYSLDALLVFHFLGDKLTGAYSIAYSLGSVAMLLPTAVTRVWAPTAQRVLAEAPERLPGLLARGVGIVVASGVVLAAGSLALRPLLPHFLHGPEFADVAPCVTWIVIGFAALGVANLCEGVLYAEARIGVIFAGYALGAVANLVGNIVFIPTYGILAAAWVTAATYALVSLVLAVPVLRRPRDRGASPIRS